MPRAARVPPSPSHRLLPSHPSPSHLVFSCLLALGLSLISGLLLPPPPLFSLLVLRSPTSSSPPPPSSLSCSSALFILRASLLPFSSLFFHLTSTSASRAYLTFCTKLAYAILSRPPGRPQALWTFSLACLHSLPPYTSAYNSLTRFHRSSGKGNERASFSSLLRLRFIVPTKTGPPNRASLCCTESYTTIPTLALPTFRSIDLDR
ncbi:hypothetical protein EV126DRAFT_81141 [Verticillium dahliae]|nr:hypothetical protein EV126DRAFT_81141 [Verticillium dahliae]